MFDPTITIALAALAGLFVVAAAALLGWQGWLALKRQELESRGDGPQQDVGSPMGAARIEISDLKERIRKLEAIASGVDL